MIGWKIISFMVLRLLADWDANCSFHLVADPPMPDQTPTIEITTSGPSSCDSV